MRTNNNLLQAIRKLDLQHLIENSLVATTPDYIELQREQIFAGIQSDGEEIQRKNAGYKGYAPKTIKIKEAKGQPTDRITLKDTGDFQADVFADVRQDGMIVDSADEKSLKLQKDYGNKIFGLASKSRSAYVEKLKPVVIEQLTDQLNKK